MYRRMKFVFRSSSIHFRFKTGDNIILSWIIQVTLFDGFGISFSKIKFLSLAIWYAHVAVTIGISCYHNKREANYLLSIKWASAWEYLIERLKFNVNDTIHVA